MAVEDDLGMGVPLEGLTLIANCTNYSLPQLKKINLVWSTTGLLMALITLGILIVLVILKTYRSPLQRLFLCLTFFTLVDLVLNFTNIILQPRLFHNELCKAIGFADVCVFTTSMLLVSGIAMYLLFVLYHYRQGKPLPKPHGFVSAVVEVAFLLVVVGAPPAALGNSWRNFGLGGPLCYIEVTKYANETCSYAHREFELTVLSVNTAIMSVNVAIFVLLKFVSCFLACRKTHVRSHHISMTKRASLLDLFLIASFVITIFAYWLHYAKLDVRLPPVLLGLLGFLVSASPVLIPIGFLLFLTSAEKLKLKKTLRKSLSKWRSRFSTRPKSMELPSARDGVLPSKSSPKNCQEDEVPSYTVSGEVGYTGAFTSVSSTYGSTDRTTYSE